MRNYWKRRLEGIKDPQIFQKLFFLIIILTISLDQITKFVAKNYFDYFCNSGFAFGFFPNLFNGYFSFVTVVIVGYLLLKQRETFGRVSLSLIFAGGISNLVDRLINGCVVDFIDLKFWPSFNVADLAIFSGVVILVTNLIYGGKSIKKHEKKT